MLSTHWRKCSFPSAQQVGRPHLKCYVLFWVPSTRDLGVLESPARWWMKGLEQHSLKRCWESWDPSAFRSLKGELLPGSVNAWRGYAVKMEPSGRTRCHGHKLECREFPFNTWERFFGKEKENVCEWLCAASGSLGRLWSLLWRSSEAVWTWPWAPSSEYPCLSRGWITWTQRIPSDLSCSVKKLEIWNLLEYRSREKCYILGEYGKDFMHAVNSTWQDRGLSSYQTWFCSCTELPHCLFHPFLLKASSRTWIGPSLQVRGSIKTIRNLYFQMLL